MNILSDTITRKIVFSFLLGVLVGVSGFWMISATKEIGQRDILIVEKNTTKDTGLQQNIGQQITQEGLIKNEAITVRNQPAGDRVILDKVTLEDSGWIVIHEGTMSQIGNALGATRFDAGEHSGVVELLRSTRKGEVYRAVLYHDNGDKEFSLDSDFPILGNANEPILTMFLAQ